MSLNSVNHQVSTTASNVFIGGVPYFTVPTNTALVLTLANGQSVTGRLTAGYYTGDQIATSLSTGLSNYIGVPGSVTLAWITTSNGGYFSLNSSGYVLTLRTSNALLGLPAGSLPLIGKPFGPGNITIAPGTGLILGPSANIISTSALNIIAPSLLLNGSALSSGGGSTTLTSSFNDALTTVAASSYLTNSLNASVLVLSGNLSSTQTNVTSIASNLVATQSNVGSLFTANINVSTQVSNLLGSLQVALGIPSATLAAGSAAITGTVLTAAATSTNYLAKSGGTLTGGLTLTGGTSALVGGSGSTITGIKDITLSNAVITANLTVSGNIGSAATNTNFLGNVVVVSGSYYGDGSKLSNLPPGAYTANAHGNAATSTVLIGPTANLLQLQGANIWANTAGDLTLNSNAIFATGSLFVQGNKQVTGNLMVSGNIGSVNSNTNFLGNVVVVSGSFYGDGSKLSGIASATASANTFGNAATSSVVLGTAAQATTVSGSSLTLGSSGIPYSINGLSSPITIGGSLSDETTAITTAGTKLTIYAPFSFKITKLPFWFCTTTPTTTIRTDIQVGSGTSIYATTANLPGIINQSYVSTDAAFDLLTSTQSTLSISQGQKISFIVNTAGAGCTGLKCVIFCN